MKAVGSMPQILVLPPPVMARATKNTALIDGVRQFALSVTDLDMDLIDRINPLAKPTPSSLSP
jgi:hypothetical protein